MTPRLTKDEWGLRLAEATALRATCIRRSVGCVLVDPRGRVLSTGYNGRAKGLPHCNTEKPHPQLLADARTGEELLLRPNACDGSNYPSGQGLDLCEAVHAEQNALMWCADVDAIETCYVTVSPCVTCVKMLMNTGCSRIVFRERYAHDAEASALWAQSGGAWINLPGG